MATARQAAARSWLLRPWVKPLAFALCLLPLAWLLFAAATDRLGANPAEALIRALGDWTLRLLCLTLAITPLRLALGQPALARFRRMLGLFTFFYAALHLLAYAGFDMGLDMDEMARDIGQRPFIVVGLKAFALLLVLAATSTAAAMRWLGGRRWQLLHRSVYLAAVLALLHLWLMRAGKNDFAEVLAYGAIVAALLLARWPLRRRPPSGPGAAGASAGRSCP
ncbi:protein-methionine-sulfoxide reductase heme-binding subunit MsrQ [Melaminivora jejuensis]|uniref:sulfite oxidase heme-binding subunit YedZ n=1 Tax=Melaminivora jejuensis TaxID=1267217 RepID=UPI001ADF886F|nr:protein-methionine-sulfoxide reductase heme-binding subunit MsrQ [Melaminivora jejuensis]UHJ64371.1 sulfoxide reductase heme-binding subunit YedZ [Melaminivora jejuensis]